MKKVIVKIILNIIDHHVNEIDQLKNFSTISHQFRFS